MAETIFTKIIKGEIKADIIHDDEHCIAIKDLNPQAPFHALVIPRHPIEKLTDASNDRQELLGHLLLVCNKIAKEANIEEGFRVVINNGASAGQSVDHLHLHILGGRSMHWPPG